MSAEGRRRLIQREGVRLKAYKDSVGVWTIGVGHTSAAGSPKVTPDLTITKAECDEILSRDLTKYEQAVSNTINKPMKQNEFDAYVSLCYNIGPGAFARSSTARLFNEGKKAEAAEAIKAWNKPPEIIGRRNTEYKQFLTPYTPAETVQSKSVPSVPSTKPDVVSGPATASAPIVVAAVAFWNSPWFWPVIITIAVVAIGIGVLIHKHKNRTI